MSEIYLNIFSTKQFNSSNKQLHFSHNECTRHSQLGEIKLSFISECTRARTTVKELAAREDETRVVRFAKL